MSAPPVPNSMTLYKRLLGYLKPYWQRFAISLVALAIAAATEPAFARLMKPLVDGGFVARDGWSMIWTPMASVGLFLLAGHHQLYQRLHHHRAGGAGCHDPAPRDVR